MCLSVRFARSFAIAHAQMGPKSVSVIRNSGVSATEGFQMYWTLWRYKPDIKKWLIASVCHWWVSVSRGSTVQTSCYQEIAIPNLIVQTLSQFHNFLCSGKIKVQITEIFAVWLTTYFTIVKTTQTSLVKMTHFIWPLNAILVQPATVNKHSEQ